MKTEYSCDVCIVGLGPAGLAAALKLTDFNRRSNIICVDAGPAVTRRSCSVLEGSSCRKERACQMISGFGGCSLIGGGKVSAFPAGSKLAAILCSEDLARIKLAEALRSLNTYVPLKRPKITTDDIKKARSLFEKAGFELRYYDAYSFTQKGLRRGLENISSELKGAGVFFLLNTEVTRVDVQENRFRLFATSGDGRVKISTKHLILGIGRAGRSMLRSINATLNLGGRENHIDIGVRLEFPAKLWGDVSKYHNDLKLLFDGARTFCVCENGKVAPYVLEGVCFTEGHCDPECNSGFTNVGILTRLQASTRNERVLSEIRKNSLRLTNGEPVCQRLSEYLDVSKKSNEPDGPLKSSISFWAQGDVSACFPQSECVRIKEAVVYFASRLLPEDSWQKVNVFAPEVDYGGLSFPVRPDFSVFPGLYLVGDCTGRFRGILQAFCSGVLSAESIGRGEHEREI